MSQRQHHNEHHLAIDHSPREILLTKGKVAIVCAHDYEKLSKIKWYAQNPANYACNKGKDGVIYMHKLVNNTPKGFETDHINRITTDNRCLNLRTATRGENAINTGPKSNSKSGLRGIYWRPDTDKWAVQITRNKKTVTVGCFDELEDAHTARDLYLASLVATCLVITFDLRHLAIGISLRIFFRIVPGPKAT